MFRNVSFKFTTFDQNENQKGAVPIQSRKNVKFDTPAQIKAERVLLGRWIADGAETE